MIERLQSLAGSHLMFIQLTSFIKMACVIKGDAATATKMEQILSDFRSEYKEKHNFDLLTEHIDFPSSILKEIADYTSGVSGIKQEVISSVIEQKYLDKYSHAHMKIAFNYGDYCRIFIDHANNAEKIKNQIIQTSIEDLYKIVDLFTIDENPKLFDIDNLEEHAMLNQIGEFKNNIKLAYTILNNEEHKCYNDCKKKIVEDIDARKENIVKLGENGIEVQIALEVEIVFEKQNPSQAQVAQYVLSDINHRRFMQEKYNIPQTLPLLQNLTPILNSLADGKNQYEEIVEDAKQYMDNEKYSKTDAEAIINNIAKFPVECAIFYDVLILQRGKHGITMNGVSDRKTIMEYIKNGRFYEAVLDMIHVSEISIGPYNANDFYSNMERDCEILNKTVAKYGSAIQMAGVQVNFSFWKDGVSILTPQIKKDENKHSIMLRKSAFDILEHMQRAISDVAKLPRITRGQSKIDVALDLKKGINIYKQNGYNMNQTAFSIHKAAAAKNATIRLSVLPNTQTAVAEIRLVGPNPHYPTPYEKPCLDAVSYVSKVLIDSTLSSLASGVESIEHANAMVKISEDGKISSLEVSAHQPCGK